MKALELDSIKSKPWGLILVPIGLGFVLHHWLIPRQVTQHLPITGTAYFLSKNFMLETARTRNEKKVGLQGRISLPLNRGMYFPLETGEDAAITMEKMNFPIRLIILQRTSDRLLVATVSPVLLPCWQQCPLYHPPSNTTGIIEIHADALTPEKLVKAQQPNPISLSLN
jgi:uncharacterized membrane protein (UPF0127 family)